MKRIPGVKILCIRQIQTDFVGSFATLLTNDLVPLPSNLTSNGREIATWPPWDNSFANVATKTIQEKKHWNNYYCELLVETIP